ncbi:MAG: Ig-like domain-containing protein [Kofleriaceae bacterium]
MRLLLALVVCSSLVGVAAADDEQQVFEGCMLDSTCAGGWGPNCKAATFTNTWLPPNTYLKQGRWLLNSCKDTWEVCRANIRSYLQANQFLANLKSDVANLTTRAFAVSGASKCGLEAQSNSEEIRQLDFWCSNMGSRESCTRQIDRAIEITWNLFNVAPCVWQLEFEHAAAEKKAARERVCQARLAEVRRRQNEDQARETQRRNETSRRETDRGSTTSPLTAGNSSTTSPLTAGNSKPALIQQLEDSQRREAEEREQRFAEESAQREAAIEERREMRKERERVFEEYWNRQKARPAGELSLAISPPNARVKVMIYHPDGGATDFLLPLPGTADVTDVPPAKYRLTIEQDGFATDVQDVVVEEGRRSTVKASLSVKPPEMHVLSWGGFDRMIGQYAKGTVEVNGRVLTSNATDKNDRAIYEIPQGKSSVLFRAGACSQTVEVEGAMGAITPVDLDCEPSLDYLVTWGQVRAAGLLRRYDGGARVGYSDRGLLGEVQLSNWTALVGQDSPTGSDGDAYRVGARWAPRVFKRAVTGNSAFELRIGAQESLRFEAGEESNAHFLLPELAVQATVLRAMGDGWAATISLGMETDALVALAVDVDDRHRANTTATFTAGFVLGHFSADAPSERRPASIALGGQAIVPEAVREHLASAPTTWSYYIPSQCDDETTTCVLLGGSEAVSVRRGDEPVLDASVRVEDTQILTLEEPLPNLWRNFRAVGLGTTNLVVTYNGLEKVTRVKVLPLVVAIANANDEELSEVTLASGETRALSAMAKGGRHRVLVTDRDQFGDIVWSSSNEAVATVDAKGVVTARGRGTARIELRIGKARDPAIVSVNVE